MVPELVTLGSLVPGCLTLRLAHYSTTSVARAETQRRSAWMLTALEYPCPLDRDAAGTVGLRREIITGRWRALTPRRGVLFMAAGLDRPCRPMITAVVA